MRNFGHTAVDWCCDHIDALWIGVWRLADDGRTAIGCAAFCAASLCPGGRSWLWPPR
jgi:hypothetical protein